MAFASMGGDAVSARSAEGHLSVSMGGSAVSAGSAEVKASATMGGAAVAARSAMRNCMVNVLCLTMRILVCKAEWLSSVR